MAYVFIITLPTNKAA